jgi:thioredoxin
LVDVWYLKGEIKMIKEFSKADNFEELVKTGVTVFDFSATWCGPCQMLHPNFEAVSNVLTDYKFVGVDVDENPQLAGKFNVRAVPTLVVIQDGKIKNITAGYMDANTLKNFITKSLNK